MLDAPTASPFTMESVGGNHGEIVEPEQDLGVLGDSDEAERGERSAEKEKSGELEGPSRRRSSFRSGVEGRVR